MSFTELTKFFSFIVKIIRFNRGILLINFCILGKLLYLSWCTDGYLKGSIISSIGALLLISGLITFYFRKRMIILLLVFDIVVSLFLFIDLVYFRYYNDIFSFTVISYAGQIGTVADGIFSLLKIVDLFLVADILIFLPLIYYKSRIFSNDENLNHKEVFSYSLVFVLSATLLIFSQLPFDRNDRKQFGMLLYHGYDLGAFAFNFVAASPPSEEEKNQVINRFSFTPGLNKSQFNGFGKGKNLIVIQVESLQNFVIDLSVNGQVITPNLNKFVDGNSLK